MQKKEQIQHSKEQQLYAKLYIGKITLQEYLRLSKQIKNAGNL